MTSYLPTLFSLLPLPPLPSLPQNLQAHLLSFLLRRTIGHYFLSTIDLSSISADLVNGSASITALELDPKAINPALEGTGIALTKGSVNHVSANLVWPSIGVVVGEVVVEARLDPSPPPPSPSRSGPPVVPPLNPPRRDSASSYESEEDEDAAALENSVLSVAAEFVQEELDESAAELALPGGFSPFMATPPAVTDSQAVGEEVNATFMAGVIERILARLEVEVGSVRLVLRVGDAGGTLEVKVGRVEYKEKKEGPGKDVVVQGVEVWLTCPKPEASDDGDATEREESASDVSDDSESDDDMDPATEMYMSQSIADLRESSMAGSSLYASARGGPGLESMREESEPEVEPELDQDNPFLDPEVSSSVSTSPPRREWPQTSPYRGAPLSTGPTSTPPPVPSPSLPPSPFDRHLILTLGTNPLIISLLPNSPTLGHASSKLRIVTTFSSPIITLLSGYDIAVLLSIVDALPSSPSTPKPTTVPRPRKKPSPSFEVVLPTAHLLLSLPAAPLSPPDNWWSSPDAAPGFACLRLKMEGLGVTSEKGELKVGVRGVKFVELMEAEGEWRCEKLVLFARESGAYGEERGMPSLGDGEKGRAKNGKKKTKEVEGVEENAVDVVVRGGLTKVTLSPIYITIPLSLFDRLAPLLSCLVPKSASEQLSSSVHSTSTRSAASTPRVPLSPRALLDDLNIEPMQAPENGLELACRFVRVEVTCPPPGGGKEVRSGVAVVDVLGMKTKVGENGEVEVGTERVLAWFVAVGAESAKTPAFVSISGFPPEPESMAQPVVPKIRVVKTAVEIELPLLHVSLDKRTTEALQLFADDLGQWSESASLGLLLFTMDADNGRAFREPKKLKRRGLLGVVQVDLFVPRKEGLRHLIVEVVDLEFVVKVLSGGKNDLKVEAQLMDILFQDLTVHNKPVIILARTLPRNLATGSIPLLKFKMASSVEQETRIKESKIQVTLANFTYFLDGDIEWVEEMKEFVKTPAGAFETVVPNELTRLRVKILDGSIHVTPPSPNLESHLVVSIGETKVASNLMPDLPRTATSLELRGVRVLAVDSKLDVRDADGGCEDGRSYWKSKGFVQIVDVAQSTIQLRQGNGLVLPDTEVMVSDSKVTVAVCADTLVSVGALVTDLSTSFASKAPETQSKPAAPPPARRVPNKKPSSDLLSSVDPAAFLQAPSLNDMPEYLDDDVPSNIDYLADALKTHKTSHSKHRRLDSSQQGDGSGQVISDIDGETIRMLDPRGLQIVDDFLAIPRSDLDDDVNQTASVVRCRLSGCDVTVHLHEGFDWATTRKAIEAEAKAVRRRLEKIRQLLASGQAADASAEDASVLVFGSVQLGLPPGASELPTNQLIAAIDEELDEGGNDGESVAETWQSLPGQPPPSQRPTSVGRARKRLTRSPSFAIEVNLRDITSSFDSYPSTSQMASRLRVDISSLDIIDNIRTSTWRKFLTELRASDGGVVRASGASMARFELNKVRPASRSASVQEEILMKIKIFPLRLYIDQDALDFLKAFGAFKVPAAGGTAEPETSPANEPFFQRVEILPVKIKMDYKPKRVDYHALRQGKSAELMNFFHFDGSEMTLRHLVVTGVSGGTRLGELVQDIWTPDVKANQLADVISGIAPVRSVVNLGSGVANLVLLPIEQYRKDGRIARGLQRGVASFSRTTTLEALNVGARLATGTQVILEQAESVLGARFNSPVSGETLAAAAAGGERPVLSLTEEEHAELISRYAEQPNDLREGMESAYRSLGDNFRSAAQTILAVPMEVYERSGNEGPVRAVVRAVPIAVLKPMIGASEAVSKALFGLRNTLDPDAQAESSDKYKTPTRSPST